MDELRCNVVVMKGSQAKVLRLDLGCTNELQTPFYSAASSPGFDDRKLQGYRMKHSTPVSSPEESSTSYTKTTGEVSSSSYDDTVTSPFLVYDENPLFEGLNKGNFTSIGERTLNAAEERHATPSTTSNSSVTTKHKDAFWIPQNHIANENAPVPRTYRNTLNLRSPNSRTLLDKFVQFDQDMRTTGLHNTQTQQRDYSINSSIRDAVSIGRTSSMPPPLCSICQHKAPVFGKPPRRFSYEELEEATDGFSDMNFLAEGGFGLVYRGVLKNGQVVAVKQLKFTGPQGDADFSREVRVLSCAQHRNVVLLIGFCIEGKQRVLVYEYVCNGSLDLHLHGNKGIPLDWNSRLKIAIGAARGLRYLHEDCRVGCIVHRDMRPNNILLTHDFEPLVGDFGLSRWHSELAICSEERIIGTSGLESMASNQDTGDTNSSPSSPKNIYKDPDDGRQRFLLELEFMQCLANPTYIHYLAQNRYFEDEAFIGYLKYLQYWQQPEYIKFIMYPHCLYFLELLQSANFRNAMAHPGNKELAHRQQFFFWKNHRNNRLKHILPRSLPEPVAAPPASSLPPPPVPPMPTTNISVSSAPAPAASPMLYGIPPGSALAKNEMRSGGVDRRKRKKEA